MRETKKKRNDIEMAQVGVRINRLPLKEITKKIKNVRPVGLKTHFHGRFIKMWLQRPIFILELRK